MVVNFDFPNDTETYIHRLVVDYSILTIKVNSFIFLPHRSTCTFRIGRTGRAGKKGFAVSFFVSEKNGRMARDIIEVLNRTSQTVPQELVQASMTSFGGKRGGRGRGGGRRY